MSESNQTLSKKSDEQKNAANKEVTVDEALELAKSHHQAGNYTIADRTYRDILKAVPDHFPTVYFLGLLCHQRGINDEAEILSRKAVDAAPENPNVWINYGAVLIANKKYDQAIEAFDETIAVEPEAYGAWTNKSYALFLSNRYEEAEEAALQATMIDPDQVEGYINMGIALGAQQKLDEANDIWQQAAQMAPDSSKVFSNWSNALRDGGMLEAARIKGEKAVELDGKSPEALTNLANALRDLGRTAEAISIYNRATDIEPDFVRAHANKAAALIDLKRFNEAVIAAKYAISFEKDNAFAYSMLSQAESGLGNFDDAYKAADQAVRIEPYKALHYINMAEALIADNRYDEAEAIIANAVALDPGDPRTLVALADVRLGLDQIDEALEALERAISNHQATPLLLLKKAQILGMANRPEDALQVVDGAMEQYPENLAIMMSKADILLTNNRKDEARALMEAVGKLAKPADLPNYYASLVSYKSMTKEDEDFKGFQKLMEDLDKYEPVIRSNLQFSMFLALEKMGEYKEAFPYLKKANDTQLEYRNIDERYRANFANSIIENFQPEVLEQFSGLGYESDVPVFIVGMPRSGTTLTEQIISSHRDVFGAGELYDMGYVMRELGPLTPEKAWSIGEAYIKRMMRRDTSGKARFITDKMPGNYTQIGLIKSVLPNAKIIHCRRNPMDNLLSCYKQFFARGHEWTYDMTLAAKQYIEYTRVMDYWRSVFPSGMLEIDYEETVSDLETQARRLIDYIGLEWDEACLKPHKQKRSILTASKDQVIKPVYTTSVEAWRRYEDELKPMYELLAEAGVVGN